jgi:hypothetical protein
MLHKPPFAQGTQILLYEAEPFAKITIANAIWLTGEVLVQHDEHRSDFAPDEKCIWQTHRFEEVVALLDHLPERDGIAYLYALFDFDPTMEKAGLNNS